MELPSEAAALVGHVRPTEGAVVLEEAVALVALDWETKSFSGRSTELCALPVGVTLAVRFADAVSDCTSDEVPSEEAAEEASSTRTSEILLDLEVVDDAVVDEFDVLEMLLEETIDKEEDEMTAHSISPIRVT